jgi:hypothetical protein
MLGLSASPNRHRQSDALQVGSNSSDTRVAEVVQGQKSH